MGLLSGATGAGLGGFFGAVGSGLEKSEEFARKKEWEIEKMNKMWGYKQQEQDWATKAAKAGKQFEVVGKTIDTLNDQYKNINNRLRGDAGFTRVTGEEQVKALEKERAQIRMQIQRLSGTYLNMAGFSSDYTNDLMVGMFAQDGSITAEGKEVIRKIENIEDTQGGFWSGAGEMIGKGLDFYKEFYGDKADELMSDWESFKVDNSDDPNQPLTNTEALRRIYETARDSGMLSDVALGISEEAIAGFENDMERNKATIEAIKSSPEKLMAFIHEYLPKVKEVGRDVGNFMYYGPGHQDAPQSTLERMPQTVVPEFEGDAPQSTLDRMPQAGVTDQDLGEQIAASGDADVNERSLASNEGTGFMGTPRGILSGDSIYPGGISQEDLDAQNAIPRSELNLGPTPSSARQYGETRGSDWIGSTQAIDALGEAGGPAVDALTEWEVDRTVPPKTPYERKDRLMKGIKAIIHKAESAAHGYNAVAGSTKGDPDLTSMTIGEVHKKYGDKAVGIGQFKRRYLIDNAKKYLGYNTKELDAMPFNETTQNKFMELGIEDAGIDAYLNGRITIDQFHARLANIWRGLPPLRTSQKGEPSDQLGNITQIPGSELQEVITQPLQ